MAYVHKEGYRDKASERAWQKVLAGYHEESPSYRAYRLGTQTTIKTLNVRSIEAPTGIISIQPATHQGIEDKKSTQAGSYLPEDSNEPGFTGI